MKNNKKPITASTLFQKVEPWLYQIPAIFFIGLVLGYSAISSFVISFYDWDGLAPIRTYVGFKNYIRLFTTDPVFKIALKNNLIYMVFMLIGTNTICLFLALILNNRFKGRTVFRGIFYSPYVIAGVSAALIWSWLLNPQSGLINVFLREIGLGYLAKPWLGDSKYAFGAVVIASFWKAIGVDIVFFLSGLQTIPPELYESAVIDGTNRVKSFYYITVPMLKETFVIVITLTIISSFKVFDFVYAMTLGGPARSSHVLGTWMYMQTFRYFKAGLGTAISILMIVGVLLTAVPYLVIASRRTIED